MQRFIVLVISVVVAILAVPAAAVAQNTQEWYSFERFASSFMGNLIASPVDSKRLLEIDYKKRPQVDCKLYNWVLTHEGKHPQRCNVKGKIFNADYGQLSERYDTMYALGYMSHNEYLIFIARIESLFESETFIDYYVFSKEGAFLSVLCLYEAEHLHYDGEEERDTIFISTSSHSDRVISYEEKRNNVNVKIKYEMRDDGILKEVAMSTLGLYEVVDKDGYVNVREKPDGKSRVLYTIESGYFITSYAENRSKWEKVISIEGSDKKGGYIHSSRLRNVW